MRCREEVRSFYTLTFNPPHTDTGWTNTTNFVLRSVAGVASRALTVRAPTGYYNEPVYFDSPRPGIEKITVAQLEELVHSRTDLSRKLTNLELTERLSTPRLDELLKVIHGERERQALTVDADLSIALAPPPDEIVNRPPRSHWGSSALFSCEHSSTCRIRSRSCPTSMPKNHGAIRRASATRLRELEDAATGPDSPLCRRRARDSSLPKWA